MVVCPGDDFVTLYPERIAAFGLRKCRLSMVKLADPGLRLPGALMSDLSLTRYRGYSALPEAAAPGPPGCAPSTPAVSPTECT
ncbi:MAG: hypothetical protein WDN45_00480 [Caulobacteraceae bacterium]